MFLNQIGSISAPDAKTLSIQIWDKGLVSSAEKAILNSGLGLTPNAEGQVIRLHIPNLNEERRRELVKKAGEYSEQAKVAIRNIRRGGIDDFKKQEKAVVNRYGGDHKRGCKQLLSYNDKTGKRKSQKPIRNVWWSRDGHR